MSFKENFRTAITSLLANKLRSLLTMLGIIIGIGAVIAIVTVGDAMSKSIREEMSAWGGDNIIVGVQAKKEKDGTQESTEEDYILQQMIDAYESKFSDVLEGVSLSENGGSDTLIQGGRKVKIELYGANKGYFTLEKLDLIPGRLFRTSDLENKRKVVVVSDEFADSYLKGTESLEKIIGEKIDVTVDGNPIELYVIGVFKQANSDEYSYDKGGSTIVIPITLLKETASRGLSYQSFAVKAKADADAEAFTKNTARYFQSYYKRNKNFTVRVESNDKYIKSTMEEMTKIKLAIGAIAGISLIVGGIGVMNIMMVSVTERTREIGVRMALGAKQREILKQFLTEAMVICLIGGVIGVLIGVVTGLFAVKAMGYSFSLSILAIIVAVSFSMVIGVFFGYYPAKKAANQDVIDALRYE